MRIEPAAATRVAAGRSWLSETNGAERERGCNNGEDHVFFYGGGGTYHPVSCSWSNLTKVVSSVKESIVVDYTSVFFFVISKARSVQNERRRAGDLEEYSPPTCHRVFFVVRLDYRRLKQLWFFPYCRVLSSVMEKNEKKTYVQPVSNMNFSKSSSGISSRYLSTACLFLSFRL